MEKKEKDAPLIVDETDGYLLINLDDDDEDSGIIVHEVNGLKVYEFGVTSSKDFHEKLMKIMESARNELEKRDGKNANSSNDKI